MRDEVHLAEMQRWIVQVGITASALRNLGANGFVRRAREFLAGIDLRPLRSIDPPAYPSWLDHQTGALMETFPVKGLWGPARKSMNIFMVMASLNRFLCAAYALDHLEDALEVPLDNRVAGKLLRWAREREPAHIGAPTWISIAKLDQENSEKLQKLAAAMAKEQGIPRGRLDVVLWPNDG